MKIVFATTHDPDDRNAYSGTTYRMRRMLESSGFKVEAVGNLTTHASWVGRIRKMGARLSGLDYEIFRDPLVVSELGVRLEIIAKKMSADLVFSPGGHVVAGVRKVKSACWPDATFGCWRRMIIPNPPYSPLALRNGEEMEKRLSENAFAIAFSSEWACNSAKNDYGVNDSKLAFIPYGANFDNPPDICDVSDFINHRVSGLGGVLRLLFVAKDFERKGGGHAILVHRRLKELGFKSILTIVGVTYEAASKIAIDFPDPDIVLIQRLDSTIESDRARLIDLYRDAHLFLLPTKADFTPMVLAEASAYGLVIAVTDVGGIRSQVGVGNALVFSLDDSPDVWAAAIADIVGRAEVYRMMSNSSRCNYDNRLNWRSACLSFAKFIDRRMSIGL